MTISKKISLGFGIVLFLLVAVSVLSYRTLIKTTLGYDNLIQENMEMLQKSTNIDKYLLQSRLDEKTFLLEKDDTFIGDFQAKMRECLKLS